MSNCSFGLNGGVPRDMYHAVGFSAQNINGCSGKFSSFDANAIKVETIDGTNMVLREKLEAQDVIDGANIKYFNGTGDGKTDNTVAIKDALDKETKLTLFPQGEYLIDSVDHPLTNRIIIPRGTPDRNLLPVSEDFTNEFTDFWDILLVTVVRNDRPAPGQTQGQAADRIVEDTNAGTHQLRIDVTTTSNTNYTLSVWARGNGRNLALALPAALFGGAGGQAIFDLTNGTVVSATAGYTTTITPAVDNYYRVSISRQAVADSTEKVSFRLADASTTSYTGDGTSGLWLWGAQFEVGTEPGPYEKKPNSFGVTNRVYLKGYNPWNSVLATNNTEILSIRENSGAWIENMGFTQLADNNSMIHTEPRPTVINSVSIFPSKDVSIKDCAFYRTTGICVAAFGKGTERWKVINNVCVEVGLALFYSAVGATNHTIALNTVFNPGDTAIAMNGVTEDSIVLGNNILFRGERHIMSGGTGGAGFVAQGNHCLFSSNAVRDVGGFDIGFLNGFDGPNTTSPTGNLFVANMFNQTQLSVAQQNTFAQIILRPSDNAINTIQCNMIKGTPDIDIFQCRSTTNSAPDTGGEWVIDGNTIDTCRHLVSLGDTGGDRLVIKNNVVRNIHGDTIIGIVGSGACNWGEIVIENNEFHFTNATPNAIVQMLSNVKTVNRIVLRNNRVYGASLTNVVTMNTTNAGLVTEIIDEGNLFPGTPQYPANTRNNVPFISIARPITYRNKRSGIATILSGNNTITVAHGVVNPVHGVVLGERIMVTQRGGTPADYTAWRVSAATATEFTIMRDGTPAADTNYSWVIDASYQQYIN